VGCQEDPDKPLPGPEQPAPGCGAARLQPGGFGSRALSYPSVMEQTTAFMLRESEVAARLRVSIATLRRLRQRGTGPEWVRIGKEIRYTVSGCEKWLEANLGRTLPKHWRAVGQG